MNASQPMLALLGPLGTWEVVVIGVVMLLLFGNRLPEVMRSMGRGVVEFKKGLKETQEELERSSDPAPPRPAEPARPTAEQQH